MGSMMKMALPAAAIAAPFIFPGIGTALGIGASAAGATTGALPAGMGIGGGGGLSGLLSTGIGGSLSSAMAPAAQTVFPMTSIAAPGALSLGASAAIPGALNSLPGVQAPAMGGAGFLGGLLDKLGNIDPAQLQGLMPAQQPQQQMAMAPTAPAPQRQAVAPQSLADAMFGGQITGQYSMPPTADMIEPPQRGLFQPTSTTTRIG